MEAAAAARRYASSDLTALSHRLMKQFAAAKNYPNDGARRSSYFVFSPLCIYSSLSLMAAGARGGTLSELLGVFGTRCRMGFLRSARDMVQRALVGAPHPGGPLMGYAFGLWHDATRRMKPAYRNTADCFKGVTGAVNFLTKAETARKHINMLVASTTGFSIDSILDPGSVDKHTRLIHVSAFYFNGRWDRPFHKCTNNEHNKFHRLDGSVADAQFIHSNEDQFVAAHDGFKVLKMPCKPHDQFHGVPASVMVELARAMNAAPPLFPRYALCVVLPDARDGLWSLVDRVASSPGFLDEHLPEKRVKVGELRVPVFKVSVCTSVKRVLQDLGIKAVFAAGADMADMHEGEPFFVNDVVHKAVMEVDEDSAEPADPDACVTCSAPEPRLGHVDFVADHPFIFFVVEEESRAILLAGHVLDPTQQANTAK